MGSTFVIMDVKNKNNKSLMDLMETLKKTHISIKDKTISLLSELDKVEEDYKIVLKELKERHIIK
jgi:rRNA processing protein Krr1/Pno1